MKTIKTFAEGTMKFRGTALIAIIFVLTVVFPGVLQAAPIHGEVFDLRQPDGSMVPVRVWGDEFYQRVESLDGYSLIRNEEGWICYAELSANQSEFVATDVVYVTDEADEAEQNKKLSKAEKNKRKATNRLMREKAKELKEKKGFKKQFKIKSESRQAKIKKNKKRLGYEKLLKSRSYKNVGGNYIFGAAPGGSISPGDIADLPVNASPLLGQVIGLTVCVDFPRFPAETDRDQGGLPQLPPVILASDVENYLNQPGYTSFNNNGSIYDYFYDVSGGNLQYTNILPDAGYDLPDDVPPHGGYYTALHPKEYYDNPDDPFGEKAGELLGEVLNWLEENFFVFTQLTLDESDDQDENDTMIAVNIFYEGFPLSGWSQGLWPHSGFYGDFTSERYGVSSGPYQITSLGNSLSIGTFCHENGHMIADWPDLYDYGFESSGVGNFCLMASGGPSNNPTPPNAYFRHLKAWDEVVDISGILQPSGFHLSNSNTSFIFKNPLDDAESFYIESRKWNGRNAGLPDEGLVVWHVDQNGDNDYEQMTPELHYQVSLEQADGRFDLEAGVNGGDTTDLFDPGIEFTDNTLPNAHWWDGRDSGLIISNIADDGTYMYFGDDQLPPMPDPPSWQIEPVATGTATILMRSVNATDINGVEYYFDAETDSSLFGDEFGEVTFDSGWVGDPTYYRGGYTEDQSYYFRVQTRDSLGNVSKWSAIVEAIPNAAAPMYPFDAEDVWWEQEPKQVFGTRVAMTVAEGYSEFGTTIQYEIECTDTTDPAGTAAFDRPYSSSRDHMITGQAGASYTFRCRFKDSNGTESGFSPEVTVALTEPGRLLEVPSAYSTIQAAINAADLLRGDTVLVRPGVYNEHDLVLDTAWNNTDWGPVGGSPDPSKIRLTIRSESPDDRSVVDATILNCSGGRAFDFSDTGGVGRDFIVDGLTIQNGSPSSLFGAGDIYGGAFYLKAWSGGGTTYYPKPTIRNCIFENCRAWGTTGDPGTDVDTFNQDTGEWEAAAAPGEDGAPGGDGGDGSLGKGGAIYCVQNSEPLIENCQFINCYARGGDGGDGGRGGNGGQAVEDDPDTPDDDETAPGG
ncbi:MAG: M6 family metalloprotease domain-containing protein, partial [Planctomycetota bacterium]